MIFSRWLAHRESDDPEIFCLRSIPSRSKTHENFRSASPPMDSHSHLYTKLCLLIFVSALFVAEGSNLAVFLDSPKHPYLRFRYSEVIDESDSISPTEVAAAVSVLLGFAPQASLSAESSAKLDGLLVPNPFDRPHAVLMLEVFVNEDLALLPNYPYLQVGGALSSRVLLGSSQVEVQLPVEKASVVSLNESFDQECDAACIDNELTDLAKLLDGSYASTLDPLKGEFSVPLANDRSVTLHISKKADLEFILSLASVVRNIRKAIMMHETFTESMHNPAELITGRFKGIEDLQNEYGSGGIVEDGMELFLMTLTKLVDSLQSAYQGKIVGAVLFNENPSDSGSIFNVEVPARASRWLEEDVPLDITTFVAVKLVRVTLAWTTGIIFIISTFIGVYFLVNMPLTRDTLLYSNVKLD